MPPKGERRKQQIISTAKEMFMDKGFQSTHIGQVCDKLNIARGTVYQYFSNKKEILYNLLDTVIEEIAEIFDVEDLRDFIKTTPGKEETMDFVRNRVKTSISILINEPIVIKLIFKDIIGIDEEVVDRVNSSVAKIMNIITDEIDELKKIGVFTKSTDSRITASMLVGGIMMLVYEYSLRRKDILQEPVVDSIVQTYLYGPLF